MSDAVVGIDPSSKKVAMVTTYGEDTATPYVWTVDLKDQDITKRCATAFQEVRRYLKLEVATRSMGDIYVFIEDPVVGRGGAYATIVQAKVHGAIVTACMTVEGVVLVRGVNNSQAKKAEPVEDVADDDAEDDAPAEVDYSKLSIAKLRKLVIEAGFDPEDVKGADKETLIDALTDPDAADDDEDEDEDSDPTPDVDDADDEDKDDEDDDEGEDELTREELEGMTVAALRKLARDEYEATPAEVKGLDKESLIEFILDDAEDEDADDDGIEEDEEGYTEDELAEMTLDELREVCDEWDIEYPAKARSKSLIKLILEAQEEVDEDDE